MGGNKTSEHAENPLFFGSRSLFCVVSGNLYFARAQLALLKMGKNENAEHTGKTEDTETPTGFPLSARSVFSASSAFSFFIQGKAQIVPVHGIAFQIRLGNVAIRARRQ
jgi:hypothetical protein